MGGKAFSGVTRSVSKYEVSGTVSWIMQNWPDWKRNPGVNLHQSLLGSAGKSNESGDIDINLEISAYDQEAVAAHMIAVLGSEFVKPRPGNNQIFMAVPICGDESLGRVQVDFMFGHYEWQKFSYFSATKTSNLRWGNRRESYFKGLYRTEMLKAITAYCSDWVLEDGEEVIARVGPTFFHDKGLVWRYRHRPMRQDGTARVKDFKELSRKDFLAIYPSAITAITDVMLEPEKVVRFLFSDRATVADTETLESIVLYMNRVFDSDARKTISKIYKERLNNLKVEIPEKEFRQIYLKV